MEFTNFETSLKKNNQKCAYYKDTIDRIQKILNNLLIQPPMAPEEA